VAPQQVVDIQALTGDPSDNVPGVRGIGIKTAQALIQEFKNLDTLYENLDAVAPPRRQELLRTHRAEAFVSRDLVTLARDVTLPVSPDLLDFKGIHLSTAQTFLQHHGFKTLIPRLPQESPVPFTLTDPSILPPSLPLNPGTSPSFTLIQDKELLMGWLDEARRVGRLALHVETSLSPSSPAPLQGIALATAPGGAAYIPLAPHTLDSHTCAPQILWEDVLDLLKPVLEDPSVLKIGHHLKEGGRVLQKYGLTLTPFDDTLLLSYVLHGTQHPHTLDFLSQRILNYTPRVHSQVTGNGKDEGALQDVPLEAACREAAEKAEVTLRLWQQFRPDVHHAHLNRIYEWVERPLVPVLMALEARGIRVDPGVLAALSASMGERLDTLAQQIYSLAGQTFNLASPQQLGQVLFEHMGLPSGKKTKTGAHGTNADILEKLAAQGHSIARLILDWRTTAKLKSTYADALAAQINPATGRLHTSFIMAGTSTGRLASAEPNLQNIPIRTEEGRGVRRAFIPGEGLTLASFDYSQIELRLLAHMGQVTPLLEAFRRGADIHQETAAQVFGVPVDQVSRDLRRKAKTINFGIIYGISAYGLATRLGLNPGEASQYIKAYLEHYKGIQAYMNTTKTFAKTHGYVETLWGRRCYLPGLTDPNPMRRQGAERQAINAPLQGTAADLIKRAMVKVHAFLQTQNTAVKMVLQIHDELLFEGPAAELKQLAPSICQLMTGVVCLEVPLVVAWQQGANWDEAH